MIKFIMRQLGWAPLSELADLQSEMADQIDQFQQWASRHERESERLYNEMAERWAETREALYDRKQLHQLQKALLQREALLPPRPTFIGSAHNAHSSENRRATLNKDGVTKS